jgi:hypothetical protein
MNKTNLMHDLKPERPDLTPPLPAVMMVVPVLFYLSSVASIGLGALFTIKARQAKAQEQQELAATQDEQRKTGETRSEFQIIEQTNNKAKEVISWMESTQPLMDVVSAVVNSVKQGNTLSALRLSRNSENSGHVDMSVEINTGGNTQQQEIVQALIKAGFQTFKDNLNSGEKGDQKGAVTYTATLVKPLSNDQ